MRSGQTSESPAMTQMPDNPSPIGTGSALPNDLGSTTKMTPDEEMMALIEQDPCPELTPHEIRLLERAQRKTLPDGWLT